MQLLLSVAQVEKIDDYDYDGKVVNEAELQKRVDDGFKNFATVYGAMSQDMKEAALRQYLIHVAGINHRNKVHKHMQVLNKLVGMNIIQARLLCEQIMGSEKLIFQNQSFWIECFQVLLLICKLERLCYNFGAFRLSVK